MTTIWVLILLTAEQDSANLKVKAEDAIAGASSVNVEITDSPLEIPLAKGELTRKQWRKLLPLFLPLQPFPTTERFRQIGTIELMQDDGKRQVLRWYETGKNLSIFSLNGEYYTRKPGDGAPIDGGIAIELGIRELLRE